MAPLISRFLTVQLLLAIALVGCSPSNVNFGKDKQLACKVFAEAKLDKPHEVQAAVIEAASNKNAIVFVHVDWSIMKPMREMFVDLMLECERLDLSPKISFRYIDCTSITTGYAPLRALPGWIELEQQNNGQSLLHGYGEFVWIRNGCVLHVESPFNFDSTARLLEKTRSLGLAANAE